MKNKQQTQKCQNTSVTLCSCRCLETLLFWKKLGYYFKYRHPVLIFIILHIIIIYIIIILNEHNEYLCWRRKPPSVSFSTASWFIQQHVGAEAGSTVKHPTDIFTAAFVELKLCKILFCNNCIYILFLRLI